MIRESRVNDALDPSSLNFPSRFGREIKDRFRRAQDSIRFGVFIERINDGYRFVNKCHHGSTNFPVIMQITEYPACFHCRIDQLKFLRVKKMGDESRMLVHNVGPKCRNLIFIKFRLAARECFEPPCPALGLVLRVFEEKRPYQAAQLAGGLRLAETSFIVYEWLDRFRNVAYKILYFALLRRAASVNLLIKIGEGLVE